MLLSISRSSTLFGSPDSCINSPPKDIKTYEQKEEEELIFKQRTILLQARSSIKLFFRKMSPRNTFAETDAHLLSPDRYQQHPYT